MTDQKSYYPPTPKSDFSPRVDVDPVNVDGTLPPGSANSADNAVVALGATATPLGPMLVDIYDSEAIDPVYQAKSHAISCAIQELGMGKYQVYSPYRLEDLEYGSLKRVRGSVSSGGCLLLLVLGGSGTSFTGIYHRTQAPINLLSVLTAIAYGLYVQVGSHLILPVDSGFQLLSGLILTPVVAEFGFKPPYLSLALNIGLFVGAVIWGVGCDVWGRRWSFNITLFLTGVSGLAGGGSGDFITLASLFSIAGFGSGGNLPVDSAAFLG